MTQLRNSVKIAEDSTTNVQNVHLIELHINGTGTVYTATSWCYRKKITVQESVHVLHVTHQTSVALPNLLQFKKNPNFTKCEPKKTYL